MASSHLSSDQAVHAPAFERAFRLLLNAEGGYVDDPRDAGGPTKHGISLRAVRLRDVDRDGQLDFDLDRDGDVDAEDIKLATEAHARQLFLEDYWRKTNAEAFPDAIAIALADSAYLQGPRTAVALLQRAVGVKDDGVVGEKTLAAVARRPVVDVLKDFAEQRLRRMWQAPSREAHFLGWSVRVMRLTADLVSELRPRGAA